MNDYQMSFLANDHRDSLLAEARRARQARDARATNASSRRPRRVRGSAGRASLSLLLGRVALF